MLESCKEKPAASKQTESEEEQTKKEPAKEKPSKKEPAQAKPETPKEKALDALGLTGEPTWSEVKKKFLNEHPDRVLNKFDQDHPTATKEEREKVEVAATENFKKLPTLPELKEIFNK